MNTWRLSLRGIRTVTVLELKQRVRSRKVFIALGIWLAFLLFVTWAVGAILRPGYAYDYELISDTELGRGLFSFLVPFILFVCLLITPAFASSSIVSDREQGVLAVLQATRLTPVDIAAGKLIAAWTVAGAFVLVGAPFLLYAVVLGGISVWQVFVCLVVTFLEIGFVCAIGVGWSSMAARSVAATVLTYLSILMLTLFSLLLFAMSSIFVSETVESRTWGLTFRQRSDYGTELSNWAEKNPTGTGVAPAPPFEKCSWDATLDYPTTVAHTERTWWLLIVNPFVIVADAAPLPADAKGDLLSYMQTESDLQAWIKYGVRVARMGAREVTNDCGDAFTAGEFTLKDNHDGTWTVRATSSGWTSGSWQNGDTWVTGQVDIPAGPVPRQTIDVDTPVWPWGLASNLLIGGLFFRAAVVRLRVPYGALARGVRVA